MINDTFYMLSPELKKDVIDNIDTQSLDDIEAKLSIICMRNKISFSEEDTTPAPAPTVYNVNDLGSSEETVPAWVKAVLEKQKTM